ncbi:Sec-independent protein translocase protein TatB [Polycladidibacter stylochi]|uniref:Sec-independent protein translocase protein TatB n=1 Tax=Polycladidibacter stylochi TaxID=1807766 RepID=UPI0009E77060|nr:Sec-independent protein translocase protein TatB [Pseudovibrio stylochi]
MFDVAWTELLVVAVIAILVVGPKELPGMLRTLGKAIGTMRRLAGDFQSTLNDAVKEAEKQAGIDEMRKQADAAQNFNPLGDLKESLAQEQKALQDTMKTVDKNISSSAKDSPSAEAESTTTKETVAATPAKSDEVLPQSVETKKVQDTNSEQ